MRREDDTGRHERARPALWGTAPLGHAALLETRSRRETGRVLLPPQYSVPVPSRPGWGAVGSVTATRPPTLGQRRVAASLRIAPLLLILFATGLRLFLLAVPWPPMRADEATMGVMALHITQGARPVFFYGQDYMGALEAYLAAPLFLLGGVSTFALRLPLVLLYALFLAATYLLGCHLAGRGPALTALAILTLGSPDTLWKELEATGGYLETLACGALVSLCVTLLLVCPALAHRSRMGLFTAWGFVAGVGLWSDLLVLPFLATSGLALTWTWWQGRRRAALALATLGALALGSAPLLAANLTAVPGRDSWHTLLALQHAGAESHPSLGARLLGATVISLPVATGATSLCPSPPQLQGPLQLGRAARACATFHAMWGLLWLVLLIMAGAGALWQCARGHDRPRAVAQLMILSAAALTVALYALSPIAALNPRLSGRYLLGVWIALPLLLASFLDNTVRIVPSRERRAAWWATLSLLCVPALLGTAHVLTTVPVYRNLDVRQRTMVAYLEEAGLIRLYTDYWTCNRLAFQSQERVICAVLDERLHSGLDRYRPYRAVVHAAVQVAYAFPKSLPQAAALRRHAAQRTPVVCDGYLILTMRGHNAPPLSPAQRVLCTLP